MREKRRIPWLVIRGGVYYVYWYDDVTKATKRLSLRTNDAATAQASYAAFLAEGSDAIQAPGRQLTVKGALDDYLSEHVADRVVDTRRARDAAAHLVEFFGDGPLSDVDIPSTRMYADARRSGKIGGGTRRQDKRGSASTIRRELVVLRAAANHAAKWRRISLDQLPSIELPPESPSRQTWLTKEELRRALSEPTGAMTDQLRDFITVAYYTGARRASVENLTRAQVDLRAGRINLTSEAETGAQRRSKKNRPVVPIDPRARSTIERLMIGAELRGEQHLFTRRDMYRPFREHMEALGLWDKANIHILRHSRATHLLQDGVPIYDVARLLGDTVATVERVYGHHSADHLATTIGRTA